MAPESKLDSGRNEVATILKGFQFDRFRWEWPNPKGEGLQKLMVREHIAGILNVVENGVKNGHRALEGLLQQGIRSTSFCRNELPNAWRGNGRQVSQGKEQEEPVRTAVLSSSMSTLQGTASANAAYVEENGGKEMERMETQFRFSEAFRVPEINSDGAVTKEDLGRATWTFLHTLAAQYPEKPTRQQQRDVKELMSIMTRLYPCKTCAEHLKEVIKAYPVRADSGVELAQWMCQVHNVVNRSLGKPQFSCQRVDARWGALYCDEGACDLEGRLLYK